MELFDQIIRIIEALAWPAVVLAIFLVSRKQILSILPNLRRLKAGPVSAEFEKDVEEVKEEQLLRLPKGDLSPESEERLKTLTQIAQLNPKTAILDAWQGVEFSLRKAVLRLSGTDSPPPAMQTALQNIKHLATREVLDSDDVALLHDLRGLRNQAAHLPEFSLSFDAAQDFLMLSVKMEERLSEIAGRGT